MGSTAFDTQAFETAAIAADAVALAELHGGTGHERVRIDWLQRRLAQAPGSRYVDSAGNLVWTFGPPPYRLAVLVHVDDVFGEATARGVTPRDGWLCGPGIGDNAIAVATAVAVAERLSAGPMPLAVVFTVGEEGLGGLRGARHACRELAPEAVLALEGHGCDRVFTDAVGSLRVRYGEYDVEAFFDPSGGPYGRVGWIGVGAYLVGIGVEVPFMSTTLYTGPAARAMNGTDLSWIVGLAITVPLYYLLAVRTVARRPAVTPEPARN